MLITFEIDAPLFGYRASISRRKKKNGQGFRSEGAFDPKYRAFLEKVGWLSIAANAKRMASKASPVRLSVEVFWKANPRLDWPNVYKAVEDGIFPRSLGGDRFVKPGSLNDEHYDTGKERAVVTLVYE